MTKQEFCEQFTCQFLATWCANNMADYCSRGLYKELKHPPVEDAQSLARDAWEELKAVGE